ncbi:protein FAM180A isoform X2 [Poecilia reticulata]|uniref:protein FAM180A isoform X2 n=1 Tax=Poecilia reticulata TaxID=8081 RepID=UPI0004A29FEA|nr:PREDICTED: protein FAM180A-like isoform X2 [Poecilia reticulata]
MLLSNEEDHQHGAEVVGSARRRLPVQPAGGRSAPQESFQRKMTGLLFLDSDGQEIPVLILTSLNTAALYPSAYLIKRGAYSLINPTFLHSEDNAKLLFEILLAGMQIQGEERPLLIPDEELASLRSVKTLEVICEDVLPKKLSDIRRLMAELAQQRRPLGWPDFERTVLTLVYSSQILSQISNQHQKELWMETLVQLVRAVQRDLTPS